MPYSTNNVSMNQKVNQKSNKKVERKIELKSKLRVTIVGVLERTKRSTLDILAQHLDITHYHRTTPRDKKINNIKYVADISTEELVNSLLSSTDYILIDYEFSDRLTGIIMHAISLEIPFIIKKSYADKLKLPDNICVKYDKPKDIIDNVKLLDKSYYLNLITNIRTYKETLINTCNRFFDVK